MGRGKANIKNSRPWQDIVFCLKCSKKGLNNAEISRQLNKSQSTVNECLAKMVEEGYLIW